MRLGVREFALDRKLELSARMLSATEGDRTVRRPISLREKEGKRVPNRGVIPANIVDSSFWRLVEDVGLSSIESDSSSVRL